MKRVAVLFARQDSIYKEFPACDVYDQERDARTYTGDLPVVAHPPCRAWAQVRHLANPEPGERDLAVFAVEQVRRCAGVLEHPAQSQLWNYLGLPAAGAGADEHGGFTVAVEQYWFGHRCQKKTWLYIVSKGRGGRTAADACPPRASHAHHNVQRTAPRRLAPSQRRQGVEAGSA